MSELTDLYQQYLNMDDDQRNTIALETVNTIFDLLEDEYDADGRIDFLLDLFSVLCAADGEINYDEYLLFKYATGSQISFDEFYEITKFGTDEEYCDSVFAVVDEIDGELPSEVFVLALCVFTAKGTLTVAEQEFVDYYMM